MSPVGGQPATGGLVSQSFAAERRWVHMPLTAEEAEVLSPAVDPAWAPGVLPLGVGPLVAGLFGAGLFGAGLFGAGLFGAGLFGAGLFGT